MKDHPAQKAEYTAEKIKEMLFSGALKRGDKLPSESRLAAELGVGRSSVREGLRLLDASGYVEIIPNRGAFAAATCEEEIPSPRSWLEINAEKVADLLDVRSCIEPYAAALCALNITDAGLKLLKRQLDGFESALDGHDWVKLAQFDLDFHRTILNESHNRYLIQIYQPLLEGFMQYSQRSFAATYSQGNTHSEHRSIYNAIAVRSPEEAKMAMELHITIAKRQVKLRKALQNGDD
ncbi:MAG: FadR family transcriptional regulator [Clostridia bacterium]|nr:FadR family transcriptional regulator [Clostridia bacterium]